MSSPESNADEYIDKWFEVRRVVSGRIMPATRELLMQYVEAPLQDAVGILYDKNIQTIGSSCNAVDLDRQPWISIDSNSLSDENQRVVDEYEFSERTTIENIGISIIGLHFPIGPGETPTDVGKRAAEIASKFKLQLFSWAPRWNLEEARSTFEHPEVNVYSLNDEALVELLAGSGYYFDIESGTVYMSEEHFTKDISATKELS